MIATIDHDVWIQAAADDWSAQAGAVRCRTALQIDEERTARPATAFASLVTPLEGLAESTKIVDIDTWSVLTKEALASRLLDGEVTVLRASPSNTDTTVPELELPDASTTWTSKDWPAEYRHAQDQLRRRHITMRFLLRQAGLDELASHQGVSHVLLDRIEQAWELAIAMCCDVSMLVALGGDRQRYVDINHHERANARLPLLVQELASRGVISHPRLVLT